MNTHVQPNALRLLIAASLLAFTSFSVPARAADVTVTVTAVAKKGTPPPIKKDDVQVFKARNASKSPIGVTMDLFTWPS